MFSSRIRYSFLVIIISVLVLSSSKISYSTNISEDTELKLTQFKPVIQKLIEQGVDSFFIMRLIEDSRVKFDEKFVRVNVTNFVNKPDYSSNYNSKSVKNTFDFLLSNIEILSLAEIEYGVPKEVISSILWIETKHGTYLGSNNIVSVYFSTALCNEEEYVNSNLKYLRDNFDGEQSDLIVLEQKILERSKKKSDWAVEQIKSLSVLEKISPIPVLDIKGSWAGAFGMSQFLPSSYLNWAVDGNHDGRINLFEKCDAIFSVANYLKSNGWNEIPDNQRKSVFHYNNSNDYVDAVLKLAELVQEKVSELGNN